MNGVSALPEMAPEGFNLPPLEGDVTWEVVIVSPDYKEKITMRVPADTIDKAITRGLGLLEFSPIPEGVVIAAYVIGAAVTSLE